MALKIFCNICREFMKDVTPDEASRLKGDEICKTCKDYSRTVLDKLIVDYKRLSEELAGHYNKAVVQLEETIRKALK